MYAFLCSGQWNQTRAAVPDRRAITIRNSGPQQAHSIRRRLLLKYDLLFT